MKTLAFGICALFLPSVLAQTATYTSSNQNVVLTGLGGSNGVGQSSVQWGNCVYDGSKTTNCTVTAPYTGVGGGGTISIVLSYTGNGKNPWLANSINPGSNLLTFGLTPGSSGIITVSLQENTGKTVTFLGYNFNFHYSPGVTCTGTAVSTCAVDTVGVTPGAVMSGPVFGTFDQTPVIRASQGVISASAYGAFSAVTPGTWMEIYGTNLANVDTADWSKGFVGNAAPTNVGETTVTIGGQPAFIDYASPTQVNAQVPSNVATGLQSVVVTTPGGTSAAFNITVNATEPGLLAPVQFGTANGTYIGAVFGDGTTFVLPPGFTNAVASFRAKPGNEIVFFGVGFGPTTPTIQAGQIVTQSNQLAGNLQIYFAGVPATVKFAGLVGGYLGLYQFNVVVPSVPPSDTTPVTFTLNGTQGTQGLIIPIGN